MTLSVYINDLSLNVTSSVFVCFLMVPGYRTTTLTGMPQEVEKARSIVKAVARDSLFWIIRVNTNTKVFLLVECITELASMHENNFIFSLHCKLCKWANDVQKHLFCNPTLIYCKMCLWCFILHNLTHLEIMIVYLHQMSKIS